MGDNARIRRLKAQVKNFLDLDDRGLMQWWVTPNPAFHGKTPKQMASRTETLRKMEMIIRFSDTDLSKSKKGFRQSARPTRRVDDGLPF